MADIAVQIFRSLGELTPYAARYDALAAAGDPLPPTVRFEPLADFLHAFAPKAKLTTVVVSRDERWLAALPLVHGRIARGLLPVARLPSNDWTHCGDLLLDQAAEPEALAALVGQVRRAKLPLLWFNGIDHAAPRWTQFLAEGARVGLARNLAPQFEVARITVPRDFVAVRAAWSRNLRQKLNKLDRKSRELPGFRYEVWAAPDDLREATDPMEIARPLTREEVAPQLGRAFTAEDRSWKGAAGTSVLRAPGIWEFHRRQAESLTVRAALQLHLLCVGDAVMSFALMLRGPRVMYPVKIGYDEAFSQHSPGLLLFFHMLRRLAATGEAETIDCMGPISDLTSRWPGERYTVSRLVAAPRRILPRMTLALYRGWRRLKITRGSNAAQH